MDGIPAHLYHPLRATLLDCGPFVSNSEIRAVFAHATLRPWRDRLPAADTLDSRVDAIMTYLCERRHSETGENVLISLLRVLSERIDSADECHGRLAQLADELEAALSGTASASGPLSAAPHMPDTANADEIASLRRQLLKLKRNLLTVEEQLADFIDPRAAPPDLQEGQRMLQERIAHIEQRLAELQAAPGDTSI